MALKCGIFDSTSVVEVDGIPRGNKAVDAAFLAREKSEVYRSGVIRNWRHPAGGFAVTADGTSGGVLTIAPGACIISGYSAWDDASASKTVQLDADEDHVWAVMLVLDMSVPADAGIYLRLEDVSDGRPPIQTINTYEMWLATVAVPMGTTHITQAMITDRRADDAYCGWCRAPLVRDVAPTSDEYVITIPASQWVGSSAPYTCTVAAEWADQDTRGSIGATMSATAAQREAYRNAQIHVSGCANGAITLVADGLVPTIDLPASAVIDR